MAETTGSVSEASKTRPAVFAEDASWKGRKGGAHRKGLQSPSPRSLPTGACACLCLQENEKKFIKELVSPLNGGHLDAWIKSAAIRFYEIDYAWKKGEHPKRGKFSPDFFLKIGNLIVVVEIKGDEELLVVSEENRKKNEYALAHFKRINDHLKAEGKPDQYHLTFLTESGFTKFFQALREKRLADFRSELDVKLAAES